MPLTLVRDTVTFRIARLARSFRHRSESVLNPDRLSFIVRLNCLCPSLGRKFLNSFKQTGDPFEFTRHSRTAGLSPIQSSRPTSFDPSYLVNLADIRGGCGSCRKKFATPRFYFLSSRFDFAPPWMDISLEDRSDPQADRIGRRKRQKSRISEVPALISSRGEAGWYFADIGIT